MRYLRNRRAPSTHASFGGGSSDVRDPAEAKPTASSDGQGCLVAHIRSRGACPGPLFYSRSSLSQGPYLRPVDAQEKEGAGGGGAGRGGGGGGGVPWNEERREWPFAVLGGSWLRCVTNQAGGAH